MTILDKIAAYKRLEVDEQKKHPLPELNLDSPRGFRQAIEDDFSRRGLGLIAEIKKASPSKGIIRQDFDPASLARDYEEGGASCLSVLTDTPSFQGDLTYLTVARREVKLPCLRKDFMIDVFQIDQARALGADAILIIMAMVDDHLAQALFARSSDLGMDSLIEVHDEDELMRAISLFKGAKCAIFGINNRNLKNFDVSLETTLRLAKLLPKDECLISESGIFTPEDIDALRPSHIKGILVGESLMRQENLIKATKNLLSLA